MNQQALIEAITLALADEPAIEALFLAGSYGRGTADAHSDVDLIALVAPEDHAALGARWRTILPAITPIVFWNEMNRGGLLLNAVSEDWLRCDLSMLAPAAFTRRARDTVKPLLDRHDVYASLPATLPPQLPNPERVSYQISEFIRVLGLLPVGIGRSEYVTGVTGVGLLRDLLVGLLIEDVPLPDRGGALHLSKLLPPGQMAMLAALPYPKPDRAEVIAANLALAHAFFPRARVLARRLNLTWPTAFEAATRRHLGASLGMQTDWN
ncbi:MAG TPA: nucleotidyltransferase domain-containing protein [Devosia sp.]|nr:nucleotidyltransferase domain-containing protein [Devosia sp.]